MYQLQAAHVQHAPRISGSDPAKRPDALDDELWRGETTKAASAACEPPFASEPHLWALSLVTQGRETAVMHNEVNKYQPRRRLERCDLMSGSQDCWAIFQALPLLRFDFEQVI